MSKQYTQEENMDIHVQNKTIHGDLNTFGEKITKYFQSVTGLEHPGDDATYGNDYIAILNNLHEIQHTLYAVEMQRDFESKGETLPWEAKEGAMDTTFSTFAARHKGWVLRVRERQTRDTFNDVESIEALVELIKGHEGKVLHIKLFGGNDEYGPIEEGRGNYIVQNGMLRQASEWKFEIRNCVGLAQCVNESIKEHLERNNA